MSDFDPDGGMSPVNMNAVGASVDGLRIVNVPDAAGLLPHDGVDVHGAPARGLAMHSNGHLGADLIHVKAGDQFPVHVHPGDHLLYCVSGEGTMTVEGVTYRIVPGDLYMVDGNVPHAVGAITDHVIMAIGAPHKPVDSSERMAFVDWRGRVLERGLTADELAVKDAECLDPPKTQGVTVNRLYVETRVQPDARARQRVMDEIDMSMRIAANRERPAPGMLGPW